MIIIIITNHEFRNIQNLMMCNTAFASIIYSILQIISAYFGLREDSSINQPACIFRTLCYNAVCICVTTSYAMQSISRLFFAVLYKYKFLLTYRIHLYLIILNYILTIFGPIPLYLIKDGVGFEIESRLCTITTKVFSSSMWAVSIAYLIPVSTVTIVYGIIFYYTKQSSRRVIRHTIMGPLVVISEIQRRSCNVPNSKRELKLMKNIVILIGIMTCAGIPYLILIIWNLLDVEISPPESFYLISMIIISIVCSIKMVILFFMNKDTKNVTIQYFKNFPIFS